MIHITLKIITIALCGFWFFFALLIAVLKAGSKDGDRVKIHSFRGSNEK